MLCSSRFNYLVLRKSFSSKMKKDLCLSDARILKKTDQKSITGADFRLQARQF